MVAKDFHTVDGRNPGPVEVGSLFHCLQGFIHPSGACQISEPSTVFQTVHCAHLYRLLTSTNLPHFWFQRSGTVGHTINYLHSVQLT